MVNRIFKKRGWRGLLYRPPVQIMSKVCVYAFEEDIQYADKDQILNCKVEGTWDISDLTNINCFSNCFKNI